MTVAAWSGSIQNFIVTQSVGGDQPVHSTGTDFDAVAMGTDCILFDGTNDYLANESGSALGTEMDETKPISVLCFHNFSGATPGTDEAVWAWGNAAGGDYFMLRWDIGNTVSGWGATLDSTTIPADVTSSLSGSAMASVVRWDTTTLKATVNNHTGSYANAQSVTMEQFRIGSRGHGNPSLFYSGSIAEILIVSRSLQDVEVESYKRHVLKNYLNPENISGLQHRWRTDAGVVDDGSTITWTDTIARTAVSSSSGPTLVAFQEGIFNNRSYITGSTVTGLQGVASDVSASFSAGFSLFMVASMPNETSVYFGIGADLNDRIRLTTDGGNLRYIKTAGAASTSSTFGKPTLEKPFVICIADDGADNITAVLNGALDTYTNDKYPTINPEDFLVVCGNVSPGNFCRYKTSEFMIFDRALSAAEMLNLTAYAKLYYGID